MVHSEYISKLRCQCWHVHAANILRHCTSISFDVALLLWQIISPADTNTTQRPCSRSQNYYQPCILVFACNVPMIWTSWNGATVYLYVVEARLQLVQVVSLYPKCRGKTKGKTYGRLPLVNRQMERGKLEESTTRDHSNAVFMLICLEQRILTRCIWLRVQKPIAKTTLLILSLRCGKNKSLRASSKRIKN